ncbi:DBR1-domain-containing protein [Punctularia strigosozonata HHB-11173 SS5]|uniref:DBR1-domain-containing protein n=1 Tax=Punctularia strigosozonata (strain HHB-11173) TaxID=741275 RepID=R7S0M4_PUNST|nr:DBR1-domain-containing protein [Punctularia strigosozonata HHB-11173 SS5]EIN03753.1 DBR1-domain-containing protein [Punctularia strigosozonata HHB-11173 SS5]
MKIAVEGCCHGELDAIYRQIAVLEEQNNYKVDLLLICGDFQAIRNHQDLQCMAVPDKYRQLGGFYKYYTGETEAPVLTIVIGGNHEASNYLWELYHGGWLAPNIYYLGTAGCVQVNGLRIAGASGIFKDHDFTKGFYERVPFRGPEQRSIYHIREFNVRKLSLLSSPDIFLSHDWPAGIEHHGDLGNLLRRKRFFKTDIDKGALGSPPMMGLLRTLKPAWWFSAHLHVKFEAIVRHGPAGPSTSNNVPASTAPLKAGENPDEINIDDDDDEVQPANPSIQDLPAESAPANPDEIVLSEEEEVAPAVKPAQPSGRGETKFLALDKCLPARNGMPTRQYLEVVDIPAPSSSAPPKITFDPEWLAITRAFHPYMSMSRQQSTYPDEAKVREILATEQTWVAQHVPGASQGKELSDCQVFCQTATGGSDGPKHGQPSFISNPQTAAFCAMLQIENKIRA